MIYCSYPPHAFTEEVHLNRNLDRHKAITYCAIRSTNITKHQQMNALRFPGLRVLLAQYRRTTE